MSKKEKLRPYMRQFYRGNGFRFALAMVQTVLLTGATGFLGAHILRALLENTFRVKELSFHTDVDFQREEPVIYAHAVTVIRLGALLAIAAAAAWELLAAMIRNQSTEGRYRNGKASDQ